MEHKKECVHSEKISSLYNRGEFACSLCDFMDFVELFNQKKLGITVKMIADVYCSNHRLMKIMKPQLDGSDAANMPGAKYMDADLIELEQSAMQSTIDMVESKIRMLEYKIGVFDEMLSPLLKEARDARNMLRDYMNKNKIKEITQEECEESTGNANSSND